MLADQLDYIVGVDPHRDTHALAVLYVPSGAVVVEATVRASSNGYAEALRLAEEYASGRRAFAIEGTGSYGLGLTRFLNGRGERVLEVGRLRRERRTGGKTDALDAVRAARSALVSERPSTPRAGGERQALQALVAAREGAVNAKRAGLCQLRDLLVTTPEPLRSELRPLTRARLLQRLAATRPHNRHDPELRGSLLALRSIARRLLQLTARNASSHARSSDSPAGSHHTYSTNQALDPTPPRSSSSPGHTKAASPPRPPSHDSPAPHRSPPPPAKRSATGSTDQATANSTAHSTRSSSRADAPTPPRSPTSNDASTKAKHDAKQTAASSAT